MDWYRSLVLLVTWLGVCPLTLAGGQGSLALSPTQAQVPYGCAGPVPGAYIYDCANVLTAGEVADLETHAAAVARAGAALVVYVRVQSATAEQTEQDARALLQNWQVAPSPDAGDGVVLYLNLAPTQASHGQGALVAGATLQNESLPPAELQQIVSTRLLPPLRQGDVAAAITACLDALAHDVRFGLPPTPDQQAAALLARLGLGGSCCLLLSVLLLLLANQWRRLRWVVRPTQPTLVPPGDLAPAVAGALVRGHIRPVLQQATILALACRRALVLEPIGERWVALHLLSDQHLQGRIEQVVWDALVLEATPEHFVSDVTMKQYNADWAVAGEEVRRELVGGGYFDALARRWQGCFGALGTVGLIAAFFELFATTFGRENWGWLGVGLCVTGAVIAFLGAYHVPETTAAGEQAAAPWRNYLAGLEAAASHPELEIDLNQTTSYALALGARHFLAHRLRLAEQQEYHPAWLGALDQIQQQNQGFYRYWQAFSRDFRPPSRVLFTSSRTGFRVVARPRGFGPS